MKHYCVISHTHWDREWYMTQEQFRLRLADLMDHLLELLEQEPDYIFHLDAQTVVLEDYWEVRPEAEAVCRRYIREGRLRIGPWYVQNDFLLTSGEATIRNLLLGSKQARELGRCDTVGYTPDQFGLPSQLPQILRGFGIDNCVFGRGYHGYYVDEDGQIREKLPPAEFLWQSPDGSRVLAVCMSFWYNNAQRFSADSDRAMKLVQWQKDHFEGVAATPYLLLMNGCDHIEAQEDLLPILRQLQTRMPQGDAIYQTTMEHYLELVRGALGGRTLPVHSGELLQGLNDHTLKDTNSTRIYLKTKNAALQNLLENQLEPLYTMLEMSGMSGVYPAGHLDYLWKMLIRNHAHDSICGCSKDAVERHVEDRMACVEEGGYDLLRRGMELLSAHVRRDNLTKEDYLITVFNSLEAPRTETVEVTVDILAKDRPRGLRLLNEAGQEVPFALTDQKRINKRVVSAINLPGFLEVERFRVRLVAEAVPAFGYRTYRVRTDAAPAPAAVEAPPVDGPSWVLENRYLRAEVDSAGRLDLLHRESGHWFRNVLTLEDTADLGHSYISLPLPGDRPVRLAGFQPEIFWETRDIAGQTLCLRYDLLLPQGLENGVRSASVCHNPLTLRLTLGAEDRALSAAFELKNRAKDHRLRALVSTGLDSAKTTALSPFDLVTHDKWEIDTRLCNETRHNSGSVTIEKNGLGLTVLNRGIYGYENLQRSKGVLAFTLMRATGRIWPEDTTGAPEDDSWLAPENQCLRPLRLELALYPHLGGAVEAQAPLAAKAFQNPLLVHCGAVDTRKFLGGRPALQDANIDENFYRSDPYPAVRLPETGGAVELQGRGLQVTAWKKAFDRHGYILRFFNAGCTAVQAKLKWRGILVARVWKTDLQETARQPLTLEKDAVRMTVRAKEIVTLLLEQ